MRLKQWESLNMPQLVTRQARDELRLLVVRLDDDVDTGALDPRLPIVDLKDLTNAVTTAAAAIRRRRVQRTGSAR